MDSGSGMGASDPGASHVVHASFALRADKIIYDSSSAGVFLLPYWLARYIGVITPPTSATMHTSGMSYSKS
jgi:hypothetical protein